MSYVRPKSERHLSPSRGWIEEKESYYQFIKAGVRLEDRRVAKGIS